ncbi:hypothetical protein [Roseinatronobacter alkalisoli]|uniref:EF-hand domain-containing protein n=1 Tax=Roseinatronobacter alkalisoli TaxID=3028235 RepID=A0ABT5T3H0_9RHOB|nr:hypothetical protein [Roseinatronobacter sp. HJB301]MDD7969579.1 hypothetical protein [Roseinatronobacter sp. HJB301]
MTHPLMLMIGVTALGFSTLTADARSTGRPAMPGFEQLDHNQSGSITLEDFQTHLQTMRSDRQDQIVTKLMEHANDDGLLNESALRAGLDALAEDRRTAMTGQRRARDASPRGDSAEFAERMFGRIDANGDGVVDAQEYDAFTERMQARMMRHDEHRQGGRWGGPGRRGQD